MSALNKKSFLTYLKEGGIYVVLLVLLAIIIFQDPTFLSLLNLSNILTQSSVRIIIALGVAGLIVTQGTDLSAGRQVGLAAVVAATLLQSMDNANKVFPEMATMPIALVILIVCAIGAMIGLINGLIIAYLNVTPFITTLGTMIIVYGINSLYYDFVGASPISGFDSGFSTFAQGFVALGSFRLSYITFYALIAVAFVWVLWNKTRFGKNIFAIGGGHPVIHASTSQSIANTVSSLGDNSVLTQPTSFTQDDWENRTFSFGSLVLKDTDFGLGRNATLNTTIQADNSSVTLGDSRVFIDKKDGQGTAFTLEEGTSVATKDADKSVFNGTVNLDNQSVLNINEIFNGGIQANNSTVNISSDSAVLGNSTLTSTALNLNKGANALASQSFVSDGPVNISDATLSLNSRPDEVSHTLLPVYDYAGSWNLKGDDARLNVGPYSMLSGNINVQDKGTVTLGGEGELSPDLTLQNQMLYSLFNGYRNTWSGSLNAPDATVSMTDTQWSMNGNSTAGNMKLNRTIVGFNGGTSSFTTLTTDNLDAVQSAFVMRTDLNKADKLVINKSATGHDNSIWVNFLKKPSDKDTLDIPLVSAPEATADNLFRASTRVVGFSDVTPTLSVRKEDGKKEWVLDGYQVARNDGQGKAAATFMHISYNNFITEVNNLNKRMGDLRDINGEAGTWVRLLNGSGSADGGFTDHYTLLQMGADRKHELGSMDLFTGVMATYTDTDASAGLYSGKTKSWGGGFYASGLFRSGAYFDLIAKYIHNENKYDLNFAGAGKQNFRSHSLYAGAEVGYRYHLTDTTFVEPQAELVWGRLQGQTFNWNDSGMDVSMRRNSVNPLVGRTGVVSGKTFSGKDWSLTARAGLHYEFDLTDSADVHLKDAAGEHQINGRKDGRMLYGVGLNARFGDNTRLGLEVERSAFGKYNTDDAINANIRYSF